MNRRETEKYFVEIYRAYSAKEMGRDDIETANNIILFESVLQRLSLMNNFNNSKIPALFSILNIALNMEIMSN